MKRRSLGFVLRCAVQFAQVIVMLPLAVGSAYAATQFTLAGAVNGTTGIHVDDDLDVYLNGSIIYTDHVVGSGTRPPITFLANTGDTLRFVVRDTFGGCTSLSSVFLFNATHQGVLADQGFDLGCARPPGDQGISHDLSFQIPDFRCQLGDIIAAAGFGLVFKVDPVSGKRSLISDFQNAQQGPTGFPANVTAGTCDAIYAVDQAIGGKLFKVLIDGTRTLVSDAANAAQGPAWQVPFALGLDADGSILVTDRGVSGGGEHAGLWHVDATSGFRTMITDSGAVNGTHSAPQSVMLDADGNLLMGDAEGPHWLGTGTYCWEYGDCGALFRVDRATGALTVLSDFGDLSQGPRGEDAGNSLALESDGSVLMVDGYYMNIGALFRVNIAGAAAGTRAVLTTGLQHFSTVAIGADGTILIGACDVPSSGGIGQGICRVDPVTGTQTVLSDFDNAAQGVTGTPATPLSITVVPRGDKVFKNGFDP